MTENTIGPRFAIESCIDGFVRITIVCRRPASASDLPDQEARGVMAEPRCIWFMCAVLRGFALQWKKPMIARALQTLEKCAQKNYDLGLRTQEDAS